MVYALAVAYGLLQKHAEALRAFEQARQTLPSEKDLPFDHNQSVCLLRLAEASLSAGNTEEADSCFARVATLGKLGSSVVQSRIRIGMIDLSSALNKHDMASACVALEKITGLGNLNDDQRSQIGVMASALNARIALRRNDAHDYVRDLAGTGSLAASPFSVTAKGVYYLSPAPDQRGALIRFIGHAGGEPKTVGRIPRTPSWGLSLSPDAKFLLYSQYDQSAAELMLVENFH